MGRGVGVEKGSLYLMNINGIKGIEDQLAFKVFGVRIAKFLPNGWELRQELAPSRTLLFKAKALEKNKEWDTTAFQEFYLPNYLNEIRQNDKAYKEINEIATTLNKGHNVYYACYCKDHTICHRSIVGDIFERNGYNVTRK